MPSFFFGSKSKNFITFAKFISELAFQLNLLFEMSCLSQIVPLSSSILTGSRPYCFLMSHILIDSLSIRLFGVGGGGGEEEKKGKRPPLFSFSPSPLGRPDTQVISYIDLLFHLGIWTE